MRKEQFAIVIQYARHRLLRLDVVESFVLLIESVPTSNGMRTASSGNVTTHWLVVDVSTLVDLTIHIPTMIVMEATLESMQCTITPGQWRIELESVASSAFAPHDAINPVQDIISKSMSESIAKLLRWACSHMNSPLAIEMLAHASTCDDLIVLDCASPDIECCFAGVIYKDMKQVCFCNDTASGVIDRSKYIAMNRNCLSLVYCFYQLGHIAQYMKESVVDIISTHDDWNDAFDRGVAEDLRYSYNQCMMVLYQFVTNPPCSIRRRRKTASVDSLNASSTAAS